MEKEGIHTGIDPFNIQKRLNNPKKYPGVKKAPPEKSKKDPFEDRQDLKDVLQDHNARLVYMEKMREWIKKHAFRGAPIEVTPDGNDMESIKVSNGIATFIVQISLNDKDGEKFERVDSLSLNSIYRYSRIQMYGEVSGNRIYLQDSANLPNAIEIVSTLIKHIERYLYPQKFGYEKITYEQLNHKIRVTGIRKGGEKITLNFLEGYDNEVLEKAYIYLVENFGITPPENSRT